MSHRTRVPTTGDAAPPPDETTRPTRTTRRRATRAIKSGDGQPAPNSAVQESGLTFSRLGPEQLARALRAVASELERDPALAQRVSAAVDLTPQPPSLRRKGKSEDRIPSSAARETNRKVDGPSSGKAQRTRPDRAFQPRVVEGVSTELGMGILDPFAVRARGGEEGLRAALAELRLGSLRAIVREHRLDPQGSALRGHDAEKLRAMILEGTAS